MSLSINTVHLGGNVTRDPQVRFLANENAVCNFGIAVNRSWKDANCEIVRRDDWPPVATAKSSGETIGHL